MYRILCVVNKTSDAMAYYRSALPLIRMSQEYTDIQVDFVNTSVIPTWDLLSNYNVLLAQRPDTDKHVDFIAKCKMHKLKIWVDFDDAFWHVTPDSPAFSYYNSKGANDAIKNVVDLSDVITVSTSALCASIQEKFGKESFVIKNAVDLSGMQWLGDLKPSSNNITWRGSHTHQDDLMSVHKDLVELDGSHDLKWTFMGYNPWMIIRDLKQALHVDYFEEPTVFFETLRRMDGNILIVPLNDNPFNRCKSNIAGLEAIVCGKIPIAPAWWSDLNIGGDGTFKERLETVIGLSEQGKTTMFRELRGWVRDHYNLSDANVLRYDILRNL